MDHHMAHYRFSGGSANNAGGNMMTSRVTTRGGGMRGHQNQHQMMYHHQQPYTDSNSSWHANSADNHHATNPAAGNPQQYHQYSNYAGYYNSYDDVDCSTSQYYAHQQQQQQTNICKGSSYQYGRGSYDSYQYNSFHPADMRYVSTCTTRNVPSLQRNVYNRGGYSSYDGAGYVDRVAESQQQQQQHVAAAASSEAYMSPEYTPATPAYSHHSNEAYVMDEYQVIATALQ